VSWIRAHGKPPVPWTLRAEPPHVHAWDSTKEIGKLGRSVGDPADGCELSRDGCSVSDHDDDQISRLKVRARHALDVSRRDVAHEIHEARAVGRIDSV